MLGLDALVSRCAIKNFRFLLLFLSVCDAAGLYYIFANGYLTEVGNETPPAG